MSNTSNIDSITKANRDAWNASADVHRSGENWLRLMEGFRQPGFSTFDPTMTKLLQQVKVDGKRVVQIGCNNGRELLSAMSLGASYGLGIDQSDQFITQARELKEVAGSDCSFLCANIYELPEQTPRNFDICLITIGTLNWMADLPKFFEAASALLKEGGTLLIYETHPYLEMFEPSSNEPYLPLYSYFNNEPHVSNEAITYNGEKSETSTSSHWFSYTLSQVLTACTSAHMSLEDFQEYAHSNREVDYNIYTNRPNQLPLCYSLIAKRIE